MRRQKQMKWTYEKDMELIKMYNEGRSTKFIAEYFGSTNGSISGRLSNFRKYGYISEEVRTTTSFDRETVAEMKETIARFDTIAEIPIEWKADWAERNEKNFVQVGTELEKMYEEIRGGE